MQSKVLQVTIEKKEAMIAGIENIERGQGVVDQDQEATKRARSITSIVEAEVTRKRRRDQADPGHQEVAEEKTKRKLMGLLRMRKSHPLIPSKSKRRH